MRVGVASGKGGTGKTLVATNLAATIGTDLADLDVEEPNAHLSFGSGAMSTMPVSRPVPTVNAGRCDLCGECARVCAFGALVRLPDRIKVHEELCHGCGACIRLCPRGAIVEVGHEVGELTVVRANGRRLTYGRLRVGEPLAVPLIKEVKDALPLDRTTIMDCPPGTTCMMIESVRGSDYVVMVTEPTPFGVHDLLLASDVLKRMGIPHGVVINKDGQGGADVAAVCTERGLTVLGRIPFRRDIAERYARGELLLDRLEDRQMFLDLWRAVLREVRA